ncbi:segregation and condensation protein A [Thermodesulfovibrio hydrogeniphilus]
MSLKIALPLFEGPLDLLLHLIKQNKIDIYDIPIALITKQYLEYLELMKELDIEIASEFLVMAATLIYIKSKMLLPKEENEQEEEDPRQELVEQLVEYEKIKNCTTYFKERYKIWSNAFSRKTEKEDEEVLLTELNIFDLLTALKRLLDRPEPKIYIPQDTVKVEDKINYILDFLNNKKSANFYELFGEYNKKTKIEIIVTFLALLELLRLKLVKAYQEQTFGEIYIKLEEGNGSGNYF